MLKYKHMTEEYLAREEQASKKIASDYMQAVSRPLISLMDQVEDEQKAAQNTQINVLQADSQSTDIGNILVKEEELQLQQDSKNLEVDGLNSTQNNVG